MLKRLFVKVLKSIVKKLEGEKKVMTIQEYCAKRASKASSGNDRTAFHINETKIAGDFDKAKNTMQERILEQDEINECVADIQAQIIAKGYKAIEEILREHHISVVQHFVMMQLISLGSYDPEKDNLDKYTMEQLIEMAIENNQLQFEKRMIEMGKAGITEGQRKAIDAICRRNNITFTGSTKFDASRFIEKYNTAPKTPAKLVGNITEKQHNAIVSLCKKLNKPVPECKSIAEASKLIGELSKEVEANPELNRATDAQIDYVKRLLKQLNKRWTKKQEEKYRAMTKTEISNAIKELEAQVPKNNNITEGQISYIVQLCNRLTKPYNVDEIKLLSKKDASDVINSLRREYLLMLSKATGTPLTAKDIASMNQDSVKELIAQMELELKTKYYTRTPQEVEELTATR